MSPSLRSFNEGDIVYCHFPSKIIISGHNLPSKKLKMSYVGPLYIFSKYDKFLYLLAIIDGEIIEQMFLVFLLKKGLLRLPNGKTVKNINDYKLEMVKQANNSARGIENDDQRAIDCSQTSVKSVLHNLHDESQTICQASNNQVNCQSTSIMQNICVDRNQDILNLYHTHSCMTTRFLLFSPNKILVLSPFLVLNSRFFQGF